MSLKVQKLTEPLALGEGPHWDARAQALYFVNIFESSIHKYDFATGQNTSAKLDGQPSFIIPVEGELEQFVVGVDRQILLVQWDGRDGTAEVVRTVAELDGDVTDKTKVNDAKADPRGRLVAGTMGEDDVTRAAKTGSIYRLDGAKVARLEQGISVANGLAWDVAQKAFYYIDSLETDVRRYDYDDETGDISNLRYIFDMKKNGLEGFPDGQTIDTDGNLWIAVFGGSCVLQVDPRTGTLLRKVAIPSPQVTSVAFGGPNLDILYVTSANFNFTGEQKYPAGCTFAVTGLGVKGYPNMNYKL